MIRTSNLGNVVYLGLALAVSAASACSSGTSDTGSSGKGGSAGASGGSSGAGGGTSGAGGNASGAGGTASGKGGSGGTGGASAGTGGTASGAGGTASGAGGATSGTGGAGGTGMNTDGSCDLGGSQIAAYFEIGVTWDATIAVTAGTGTVKTWLLGAGTQASNTLTLTGKPCGLDLPDFSSILNSKYGLLFPDSLFDNGTIPDAQLVIHFSPDSKPGATGTSDPAALLIGTGIADPVHATWPATGDMLMARDDDNDGKPGVTITAKTGTGYSPFPTNASEAGISLDMSDPPANGCDTAYFAIRNVSVLNGTLDDCNTSTGTIAVQVINNVPAINSHFVGCAKKGVDQPYNEQGQISSGWKFPDDASPILKPGATSKAVAKRVDANAKCSDIRAMTF